MPPPHNGYAKLNAVSTAPPRDSLELASLASSTPSLRSSESSSPAGISSSRKLSLEDGEQENGDTRPRTHSRTYSVSSAFDFSNNLFPLSTTAAGYTALGTPIYNPLEGPSLEKHKSLTFLNGLSLVVGLIIGSGIFSSPSQVNINAGSPGASLVVWAVAGVLAWTGAASFAELGGAIPLNGGAQVYLTKIFGDLAGFLFTWCAVLVLKPGSAAIIAIILGEYVVRAAVGAEAADVSVWVNKGVALAGLILVTIFNSISTRFGTRMGDLFLVLKFIALLGVTIIGIVVAATGYSYDGKLSQEWKHENWFTGTNQNLSGWAVALYAGLWAFDGWDNTSYVVGEFLNPSRDLPRVIHTAMPIVIVSYLLANISYIFVLPASVIASSNTIAVKWGSIVFGPIGSLSLAIMVSLSCFGALNATTFTSGRLVYAAGKEGFLPSLLGKIGLPGAERRNDGMGVVAAEKRHGLWGKIKDWAGDEDGAIGFTPVNAMIFNTTITLIYVAVGEFGTLVTFYGVAGYTFYFLTVLGLIILRVREPYLERPYKTWITTPVIFCCVSLFLLTRAVVAEPVQTLIVVGFVAVGVPVYFFRIRGRGGRRKSSGIKWKFWKRSEI
ncbi:MAG: hypothetical protein GOMPHAMPRED_003875 [Gomphillus americanus]|uniref:Amino acid transporter n=1 Tax=Gomphillus americanus TaxID=1940652 RepID=A0A8H3FQI4_9LECA|nr:MAG: hypothetical protein GOMPHAMPRED_003875 [Gomphillus americanus]